MAECPASFLCISQLLSAHSVTLCKTTRTLEGHHSPHVALKRDGMMLDRVEILYASARCEDDDLPPHLGRGLRATIALPGSGESLSQAQQTRHLAARLCAQREHDVALGGGDAFLFF